MTSEGSTFSDKDTNWRFLTILLFVAEHSVSVIGLFFCSRGTN